MANHLLPEVLAIAEMGNKDLNASVYVPNSHIVESMKIYFLPYHFHL